VLELAQPLWLLLLPVAFLVPWWRRHPRVPFSAFSAVRTRPTPRIWLASLPKLMSSAGLVLLTLAMSRPQIVDRERIVEREGIDIELVLDTSGSMEAEDFTIGGRAASRLEVSKEVIARFIDGRSDDRVGLIVFGEEAFTQVPLTLDHSALVDMLRQVDIGVAGSRATAIGDAIAVGGRRLKELEAESRVMILLTDGHSNRGRIEPLAAAKAADALGIRIYTIGVGSKDGGGRGGLLGMFRSRRSDLDEPLLRSIADTTGARYFRAADTRALAEVYETIDAMEKTTAEIDEFIHRQERFQPLVWWGLLLLLLQGLLGETVLRRLP